MNSDIYDDPDVQARWITKQRKLVIEYLNREGVCHGGIPDKPDWFLVPYLAIWRVLSLKATGMAGWWAISGDVPTDYISSGGIADPRSAMFKFSENWFELSQYMIRGLPHPGVKIGTRDKGPELGDLLLRRANLLAEFAGDDEIWQ
jgi:hypothetical protein